MYRLIIITSLIIVSSYFSCYPQGKTKITFLGWPDPGGGFEEVISDFEKEKLLRLETCIKLKNQSENCH